MSQPLASSSPSDNSAPAKGADPLAVLEDILAQAQSKPPTLQNSSQDSSVRATNQNQAAKVTGLANKTLLNKTVKAVETEAETKRKAAEEIERQKHQAQVKAEEARLIEIQRHKITQEVMHSPQYQARISQVAAKEQSQIQATAADKGFAIRQLGHDKI